MKVNLRLSKWLALRTKAVPKACWDNSIQALYHIGKGQYVEGWAIDLELGIPIEHGWIEVNGQIVDVTWKEENVEFFPGIKYSLYEVEVLVNEGYSPPFAWQYGWGGFENKAYKEAHDQAFAFIERR